MDARGRAGRLLERETETIQLIALINWYDESATWLSATVASLAKADVRHVVALDGAYFAYPGGHKTPRSGAEQGAAIWEAAHALGIGCTLVTPREAFPGNEIEKRTLLFRHANLIAEEYNDWLLIVDADEVVTDVPRDLHERLSESEHHVAEIQSWSREDHEAYAEKSWLGRKFHYPSGYASPVRSLYRANPSLRVEAWHGHYVAEYEGRRLELRGMHGLEPAEQVLDLRIEHRHEFRGLARTQQQHQYYVLREQCAFEDFS